MSARSRDRCKTLHDDLLARQARVQRAAWSIRPLGIRAAKSPESDAFEILYVYGEPDEKRKLFESESQTLAFLILSVE